MKRMKEIRETKGFTIQELSDKTGVPTKYIRAHELGKKNTSYTYLGRIAKALGVTVKELNEESKIIIRSAKCLNEACLLNENKMCISDVVLSGKAPCFGKDKVQSRNPNKFDYQSTKSLFI